MNKMTLTGLSKSSPCYDIETRMASLALAFFDVSPLGQNFARVISSGKDIHFLLCCLFLPNSCQNDFSPHDKLKKRETSERIPTKKKTKTLSSRNYLGLRISRVFHSAVMPYSCQNGTRRHRLRENVTQNRRWERLFVDPNPRR